MNCNDCGGFLPRCDCSPFGGRQSRGYAAPQTCPRCKQPAANLFRVQLPGDELDTTHCGCLYSQEGADGAREVQP